MERELTQEEASGYLGRGLDFAGNSGWLRHWFDLAQMVRDTGGSGAIRETFCWDSPARMARLWGSQDGRLVAGFRGRPWARLSCDAADRSWGVVAEGRVELSEPTREPGDATGRELMTKTTAYGSRAHERYQEAVDRRMLVVRLHITRLYGVVRPEHEWDAWEEPTYW